MSNTHHKFGVDLSDYFNLTPEELEECYGFMAQIRKAREQRNVRYAHIIDPEKCSKPEIVWPKKEEQ